MNRQEHKAWTSNYHGEIGDLVRRAYASVLEIIEPALESDGLSLVQYQVLAALRNGTAAGPTDLCVQLNVGALTRVVDQLVNRGLVARSRRSRRDRRKVDLELTPEGRQTIDALIPRVLHNINLPLTQFSSLEVADFIRLLVKFNAMSRTAILEHLPDSLDTRGTRDSANSTPGESYARPEQRRIAVAS
jgi:DNA-binding MarR family transcriptional regulator